MIDANAAMTLLKVDLKQFEALGGCNALPTALSKPYESGRVWVWPSMFLGRNSRLKYINSIVIDIQNSSN